MGVNPAGAHRRPCTTHRTSANVLLAPAPALWSSPSKGITSRAMPSPSAKLVNLLLGVACLSLSGALLPRWICGRWADDYFDGELAAQSALAGHVAQSVTQAAQPTIYQSHNLRFDGQSAVAAYQMATLGLGQIVLQHPSQKERFLPAMNEAARRLVDPATLAYAARAYGAHGVTHLAPDQGHAYLGYINLALGMLRAVDPNTPHASLHDHLTDELASRLRSAPTGLFETYPGETWPPDVAAVAGSVGLHARVTGQDASGLLAPWAERFAACALDPSGYLVQRVRSGSCQPLDAARGSGTAVAAYFLGFAVPELSQKLHQALAQQGRRTLFGFGAVREYLGAQSGAGDVNSGPVLAGVSVGATGFALGSARMHGDRLLFRQLYRSVHCFGVPVDTAQGRSFAAGGLLGNALLLAMLTARAP